MSTRYSLEKRIKHAKDPSEVVVVEDGEYTKHLEAKKRKDPKRTEQDVDRALNRFFDMKFFTGMLVSFVLFGVLTFALLHPMVQRHTGAVRQHYNAQKDAGRAYSRAYREAYSNDEGNLEPYDVVVAAFVDDDDVDTKDSNKEKKKNHLDQSNNFSKMESVALVGKDLLEQQEKRVEDEIREESVNATTNEQQAGEKNEDVVLEELQTPPSLDAAVFKLEEP